MTEDHALLRRLAEQQPEVPFAQAVIRLLNELDDARDTACRLEEELAQRDVGPAPADWPAPVMVVAR